MKWMIFHYMIISLTIRAAHTLLLQDENLSLTQVLGLSDFVVAGVTSHKHDILVYGQAKIIIFDKFGATKQDINLGQDFHPFKLVSGFHDNQLLFLTAGSHCISSYEFDLEETRLFSGNCQIPGFADGSSTSVRYDEPKDLHAYNGKFYVADSMNSCLREMLPSGAARSVLSIHSSPLALGGSLYIGAKSTLFQGNVIPASLLQVPPDLNTYRTILRDITISSIVSCTPEALAMLNDEGCCHLLPLTSDISHNPVLIDGPFSSQFCLGNTLHVSRLAPSPCEGHSSTMQIYTVSMDKLLDRETVDESKVDPLPVCGRNESTAPNTTTLPIVTTVSTSTTTTERNVVPDMYRETRAPGASMGGVFDENHPDFIQVPLHNHKHKPRKIKISENDWTVVVPSVLACLTVLSICLALACIIRRRYRKASLPPRPGGDNPLDSLHSEQLIVDEEHMNGHCDSAQLGNNITLIGPTSNGTLKNGTANGHPMHLV